MALHDSLYPVYGIKALQEQHGQRWGEIVDHVGQQPITDPYVMAFTLTIRRIRKFYDVTTELCSDPLCAVCTADILSHFPGTEEELVHFYYNTLTEITQTLKTLRGKQSKPIDAAAA